MNKYIKYKRLKSLDNNLLMFDMDRIIQYSNIKSVSLRVAYKHYKSINKPETAFHRLCKAKDPKSRNAARLAWLNDPQTFRQQFIKELMDQGIKYTKAQQLYQLIKDKDTLNYMNKEN